MALSLASQKRFWLRLSLQELGAIQQPATVMNVDNQTAISMAEHVEYQSRAKPIDLRYHFVRDAVQDGVIKMQHVPTAKQFADFMIPMP